MYFDAVSYSVPALQSLVTQVSAMLLLHWTTWRCCQVHCCFSASYRLLTIFSASFVTALFILPFRVVVHSTLQCCCAPRMFRSSASYSHTLSLNYIFM
jgi:hypothetical protein